MHATSLALMMSFGASGLTSGGCASISSMLSTYSLIVPLSPLGCLCPHRLPLHPVLLSQSLRLRRRGLALPHLCLWHLLPLPLFLRLSLRLTLLSLPRQDEFFF
ncbi:hypothetical protein B296_00006531 [Ensete ventricosum]|uniref:Secreted protein n=1 Tax=Ensete ventricosum TaxID=4639 RepID=A0A426ZTK6_ENSVE|nr:hypothetical protein B296_00006531 [Ensete ventricosum]